MRGVVAICGVLVGCTSTVDPPGDTDRRDTADTDVVFTDCIGEPPDLGITLETPWSTFGVADQAIGARTARFAVQGCFVDLLVDEPGEAPWSLHRSTDVRDNLTKVGEGLGPDAVGRLLDLAWVGQSLIARARLDQTPRLLRLDPGTTAFVPLTVDGDAGAVHGLVPVGGRLYALHGDDLVRLSIPGLTTAGDASSLARATLGTEVGTQLSRFGGNLHTGRHEVDLACVDRVMDEEGTEDATACLVPAERPDLLTDHALVFAHPDGVSLRVPGGSPPADALLRSLVDVQVAASVPGLVVLAWANLGGTVTVSTIKLETRPVVTDLAVLPETPGGDGTWRLDDLWTDGEIVLAASLFEANDRAYLWGLRLPDSAR